jgi:hypothetical protein
MFAILYTTKGGGRHMVKFSMLTKAKSFYFSKRPDCREIAMHKEPFHSSADEKSLVMWNGDDCYWDNRSKKDNALLNKKGE